MEGFSSILGQAGVERNQTLRKIIKQCSQGLAHVPTQVHFFAHLAAAHVISLQSMYDLIRAVIVVLDEFGVSHGRAKQAVRCACEGLMIVRPCKLVRLYRCSTFNIRRAQHSRQNRPPMFQTLSWLSRHMFNLLRDSSNWCDQSPVIL